MDMKDSPIHLSVDLFRHDPAQIQLVSPAFHCTSGHLESRHVRQDELIIEVSPPLPPTHPFEEGSKIETNVRLPHQEDTLSLCGSVHRVVLQGVHPSGKKMSLIAVKLQKPDLHTLQRLAIHDIAVQSMLGKDRSTRIRTFVPVELMAIDVMSDLVGFDLSMTGMFVAGKVKFVVGRILGLRCTLPFQQREISLKGRVIWVGQKRVSGLDGECPGFGIQFVDMSENTRMALATYYVRTTVFS